jgi:hypothetical protein
MVQSSAFELPYLAMSHLRQGEIYDSLGELEQASEHHSRFIELWESADPEFQLLVTAARDRLEAISGGG